MTSVLFAVQTVLPVAEFEAHELTTLVVGMSVFVLVPSTFTAETPVSRPQRPFGT